jgi:S1-C subfamily serine protease
MKGEVIGINTAIFSNGGSNSGVGFAIASDTMKKVVPPLIRSGSYKHPLLGCLWYRYYTRYCKGHEIK